ncbi:flagellar biosynthesis anti-sigma factor FlgM [Helicobacter muridarum]|uniref:Flagellar anti FliA (Sigma 28) factor FlgM n=1 Tax=Helicobacter muridarum TaxID=216 RepID=A0A099TYM3_9HELI|nr:flagellar biosynthesis anti-sigma factor FlgM [Helicobacter muridarum]TLD98902.1 flagellar biosynthesis anti-sigma factor FlgM [Helicobacter muridarum]STQ87133.1 flagellar anti FliA (sigma 28) factor FlgM [Helicobacter muridarum]
MRVASSVMGSIQQAQSRDLRNEFNRNVQDKKNNNINKDIFELEKISEFNTAQKLREEKIARIKEEIKNGTYKIDLLATSDKMAQSLLNV